MTCRLPFAVRSVSVVLIAVTLLAATVSADELRVGTAASVGMSAERLARIDTAMEAEIQAGRKAGIVMLIARKGQVVHHKAYGMADVASRRPMRTDSMARLYSMTKPVTSVALLTLYEQGKFQLSDPLDKYIPAFAKLKVFAGTDADGSLRLEDPKRKPTIHDVFRHTAGFAYGLIGQTHVDQLYRDNGIDFGNYRRGALTFAMGALQFAAHEFGDEELAAAAGNTLDLRCKRVERIGILLLCQVVPFQRTRDTGQIHGILCDRELATAIPERGQEFFAEYRVWSGGHRLERHEADERTHAQRNCAAVFEANAVIKEAVLIVPEAGAAERVHRLRDVEEMLQELAGNATLLYYLSEEAKEGKNAYPKFKGKDSEFIFAGTYIWIHDSTATMRMHPIKHKMEGQNYIDLKDVNGKLFFTAMNEVAKTKGSGWVEYMWPKPGEKTPSLKVSYVKLVNAGGEDLIIGCGVYDLSEADLQKVLK
jgi:hypothetical protein